MVDNETQPQVPTKAPPSRRRRSVRPSPEVQTNSQVPPALEQPSSAGTWFRIDLHIHTPASADYQQPDVNYLDILHKAEERELDIVAFTDHNSVRGYADLWREIEDLELLESLDRLAVAERDRLTEYRRLLANILLLPGFEFTATFGFHILAIFPERTTVRMMEHVLLTLGVPENKLGSGEVGATTDVLRAYRVLSDAGALVIGAHANSTHGVAMLGLNFGGQTKIAYTQDPHLHALEVTDLHLGLGPRSTARFFNGTKAEYPRRMHCIQGSDAHRLDRDLSREAVYGVGERPTEVLLPDRSFQALKELILETDFSRTRPFFPITSPSDEVRVGRLHGNSATQSFHEHLSNKRSGSRAILVDVAAFANSSGGSVFIGASTHQRRPLAGVPAPAASADTLRQQILSEITPPLEVTIDVIDSGGKSILAVRVPEGIAKPYALAPGNIYIRRDGLSEIASRDEIVQMVRASGTSVPTARSRRNRPQDQKLRREIPTASASDSDGSASQSVQPPAQDLPQEHADLTDAYEVTPGSGVEIVSVESDGDTQRMTIRDLRHRRLITRVNPDETRGIWREAIEEWRSHSPEMGDFRWKGKFGVLKDRNSSDQNGRLTLAWRSDGSIRVFYAVNEDGLKGPWKSLVSPAKRTPKRPIAVDSPTT
jgi:Putative DNA-binding domain